jgi:hypothetical protein
MKRPCELLPAAGNEEERDAGAGDGAVATVRVANVIATATGAAHAGQNRLLSGASAPHPAQRIILCILSHAASRSSREPTANAGVVSKLAARLRGLLGGWKLNALPVDYLLNVLAPAVFE